MRPILFVDFSGVLTSVQFLTRVKEKSATGKLDPACVIRLEKICDATACRLVVMSTWRRIYSIHEMSNLLREHGFEDPPPIIGITPSLPFPSTRGDEVDTYISTQVFTDVRMCCIDDDSDFYPHQNLIRINNEFGLSDEDVRRVIEALL